MKRLICSLFISLIYCIAQAQIPVSKYFGNGELTCDLITEICQDADGFIWVGTINGLNRYDGWTFDHIYTREGDTTSLKSNYIYELFPDSRGRLWVGTNLGLQLYDSYSESFSSVRFPDGRRIPTEHMVELANGDLWIVLGNIYRLDTESMTAEPVEEINKLTNSSAVEVFVDSIGVTWISGSRGRIYRLDDGECKIVDSGVTLTSFVEFAGDIFASSGFSIYRWNAQDTCFDKLHNDCAPYTQAKMLVTHDGRILITTAGQGFRTIDRMSMTVVPMDRFQNKEVDLNHITIDDWIEDRSGNIWLGSVYNGLTMISHSLPDFVSIGPPKINTSNDEMLDAVYSDSDGILWAGSENGDLFRYDSKGERILVKTLPASIYSLYELDSKHILAGTKYRGLYIVDKESGASRIVNSTEGLYVKKILPCPDGTLVLSLFSDGIAFYDLATGTLGRNIRAGTVNTLLFDRDGNIWCGTYGGVKVYGYTDRTSKSIQTNVALDASTVYALYEGYDGIVWIGTSAGLFSYDKSTDACRHHTIEGLKNIVVCGIAGDNDGNIWISTFNGLVKYNPAENKIDTYQAGHGLSDTKYVRGSYWQEPSSGFIAFGGQHDITCFDPYRISFPSPDAAPALTGLQINEISVHPGTLSGKRPVSDNRFSSTEKINLDSGDNDIKLFYSALDFRETDNTRVDYSLDREKGSHLTPVGSNMITLNNLKPGRHTLKVRLNENGIVSPAASLNITVRQPWYATWPAVLVYILAAVLTAVALRRLYKAFARRKASNKANEKKLDFFTRLSYELRSPMTLITIPLQKLLRNNYDDETDKALKSMQRNAEKAMSLLNQSLDVRRLDEDSSSMQYAEVNLIDFITDLLSGVEHRAGLQGVSISYTHGKGKQPVWIDQNSFGRVISDLLGNAIRATSEGGRISVDSREKDKFAEIEFRDTGMAFTEEQLKHMFKLPYRSESGNISGTDIGLYLDNIIVAHHKGTLAASNLDEGQGRRFLIRIPLGNSHIPKSQRADNASSAQDKLEQSVYYSDILPNEDSVKSAAGSRKYSVIAIDENEEMCRYIRSVLASRFKVITFNSAIEGYNFALTNSPDLIIMDLMMTDLDGITLLKRIKDSTNTAHIPVLLLTSIIEEDIRLKGLLTGADAIITKPFNEEELIIVSTNLIMSRSRLASRIKGIQVTEEMLQPVELMSNNDVLIQKVIKAINDNISNPDLDIDMLTDAVGISRAHLYRKIKDITGLPPGEYIRSIRLHQAAELLKGEKKNISQIAYSLGYSSPSVFANTFKKFYGMTAKEYQDSHAGSAPAEEKKGNG